MSGSLREVECDAVVVGSGPNGLAAAITLARHGLSVTVLEAADTPGGGTRTAEMTLPGFRHDVCSAVHPMGVASPFFRSLPLRQFGLEWVHPKLPIVHPLDGGRAAVQHRSLEETLRGLGPDADGWDSLVGGAARHAAELLEDLLGPFKPVPAHPVHLAAFGVRALLPATTAARHFLPTETGRALFAGHAAHSILPLERTATAAIGIMLAATGHHVGWPVARGGSASIADALCRYFFSLGGRLRCGRPVESLDDLPRARAYLFDTSPRAMVRICASKLPPGYARRIEGFRHGPGIFKLDLALDAAIPWTARACRDAGTVHVGGTLEEIAASERACWEGRHCDRPFVLVAQQSLFDPTRAPDGRHTCWAYCHVPSGSTTDMTEPLLAQIERFAPGFRDRILAIHRMGCAEMEAYNPNYIGGDIVGGVQDLAQTFTRPVARWDPYSTPARDVFLCSSSTPPGAGVHGMCGYHAARSALRKVFRGRL